MKGDTSVTPAESMCSQLWAASAADGSGVIMHRNNPFMYFGYDFRLLKESGTGGWRGGSVLGSGPLRDCTHVGVLFCLWIYCIFNLRWTEVTSKASTPSFSFILFAQFFYILASLPSCLPKRPDSVTNFTQYFCQSLYFAFSSTHSLVNPSLFYAVCIRIWTSHFQRS